MSSFQRTLAAGLIGLAGTAAHAASIGETLDAAASRMPEIPAAQVSTLAWFFLGSWHGRLRTK